MSQNRDDEAKHAWDCWTEEDGTTEVAQLRRMLRMAEERAAIASQAMSRVLQEYQDGYVYCEKHGHEQQEPCPQCAEEDR
jgi:hypothetical protein